MILVSGGAGFVGSNLVHTLNKIGCTDIVVVESLMSDAKLRNLIGAKIREVVDYRSLFRRGDLLSQTSAVLHFGARSATTERDGAELLSKNIIFSQRLLQWCLDHEVRCIYASSASVYGDGRNGFREDEECEAPGSPYACTKWLIDCWLRSQPSNSVVTGLRLFNVYGPRESHKGDMVSPVLRFFDELRVGRVARLFDGSESFRRDFVSVKDVCDVCIWCLGHPHAIGLINVGTGVSRSFAELCEMVMQAFPDSTAMPTPFPEHLRQHYQRYTEADLRRLRGLGYDAPFVPLEEGVKDYVSWLEHA